MARGWLMVALLAGCGDPGPPPGTIAVQPTQYDAMRQTQAVLGGTLDLVRPPQGGFVVFVGARVTGLGEETVELRGRLVDGSGAMISEDVRTATFKPTPEEPTVAIPDLRSFLNVANIAVCPSSSTTDRVNQTYRLEVIVTELRSRRSGLGAVQTQLVCRQTDASQLKLCQCECAGNYFLGKCSI